MIFLLPIGHEQTKVRRLPWVCFTIFALNLVAFIFVGLEATRIDQELGKKSMAIYEYWKQHPYLDMPPEFLEVGVDADKQKDIALYVEAVQTQLPANVANKRSFEQRKLNELIESFLDTRSDDPLQSWGFVPARFSIISMFKSFFMHGGLAHLIGNFFIFFLLAPFIEDVFGRPMFAAFYLLSGVAGALAQMAVFHNSTIPVIGASGAIAGLMGAFLVRFVRTKIRFFFWIFPIFTGTFRVPAWVMLPLWFGDQLLLANLTDQSSGVAYWSHVGGFVFGVLGALVISYLGIEEKYIHPKIESKISISQHPALDQGLELMRKGDIPGARQAFMRVLADGVKNPDVYMALWQCSRQMRQWETGLTYLFQAIEMRLNDKDAVNALELWREAIADGQSGGPVALRWRLGSSVQDFDPGGAAEVFRHIANDPTAGLLGPKAASRLAALSFDPADREYWQNRATVTAQPAQAPTPRSVSPGVKAVSVPPAAPPVTHPAPPIAPSAAPPIEPAPLAPPQPQSDGPLVEAVELFSVGEEGLVMRDGTNLELLLYSSIKALIVAGITRVERPFLLLDLVIQEKASSPKRVLRCVSSSFNPQNLINRKDLSPIQAFQELVKRIAESARVKVTPDPATTGGRVATFATTEEYEQRLLQKQV